MKYVNLAVVLLVVLACGNVALLIFARAATRESEIVVRNALGASRGRIIMQLFAEALVLGGLGTILGLAAARYGLRFALMVIDVNIGPLPFWVSPSLSRATLDNRERDGIQQELERRLFAEPAIAGVTFASVLPRRYHDSRQVDVVEDVPVPRDSLVAQRVQAAFVGVDYLEVLGAPIVSGRGFHAADGEADQRLVIVNEPFVDQVLHGRNPIGRRVRFTNLPARTVEPAEPGPWYEVVGVVKDLGMYHEGGSAGLYQPLTGYAYPLYMIAKVRGDPATVVPRLRAVASAVDPMLRLYDILPMNEYVAGLLRAQATFIRIALFISGIALLLSLAGVYAVMSFAVSRRTYEIGIRVALGADAPRVLLAVFRRPLTQIGLGIVVGVYLVAVIVRRFTGGLSAQEIGMLTAYATLMTTICVLACIVPTRRALAIEPTDALRADA